jgi:hypothetical protein
MFSYLFNEACRNLGTLLQVHYPRRNRDAPKGKDKKNLTAI